MLLCQTDSGFTHISPFTCSFKFRWSPLPKLTTPRGQVLELRLGCEQQGLRTERRGAMQTPPFFDWNQLHTLDASARNDFGGHAPLQQIPLQQIMI